MPPLLVPPQVRLVKANEHTMWVEWDRLKFDADDARVADPRTSVTYYLYAKATHTHTRTHTHTDTNHPLHSSLLLVTTYLLNAAHYTPCQLPLLTTHPTSAIYHTLIHPLIHCSPTSPCLLACLSP